MAINEDNFIDTLSFRLILIDREIILLNHDDEDRELIVRDDYECSCVIDFIRQTLRMVRILGANISVTFSTLRVN